MTDPSEPSPSGAEPPVQHGALEIRARAEVAGGLRAVASAFADMRDAGYSVIEGGRLLLRLNQKDGFDCPGCAWPDPDGERSRVAEYCENGAKAVAWEADKGRLTATFFRTHSVEQLRHQTDLWLGQQGRLTEPLVLRPGSRHYEPLGWDEAFALLADTLRGLSSPDEAVFYTSGRTSNEAAFLYQLFVRAYGTNNLPDCSNMCHESSGVGLGETLGIGKGSVTLEDFDHADTIVVMGQNPGTNHPRMLTELQKVAKRGAKIINSVIRGPAIIGEETVIENSYVGPFTSIYHHVTVQNCEIERSIILERSTISDIDVRLQETIIGRHASVRRNWKKPRALKMNLGDHSNLWLD